MFSLFFIFLLQVQEFEEEFEKITGGKPVQTRFMRSQQDLKAKLEEQQAAAAGAGGDDVDGMFLGSKNGVLVGYHDFQIVRPEPGLRQENEDSCENENKKSQIKYFLWGKKSTSILFCYENEDDGSVNAIEGTKLIFIMNFSVLDFFRFASIMPQIAQVKLVLTIKISSFFFFLLAIPGSVEHTTL